jgi:hypothetical protein
MAHGSFGIVAALPQVPQRFLRGGDARVGLHSRLRRTARAGLFDRRRYVQNRRQSSRFWSASASMTSGSFSAPSAAPSARPMSRHEAPAANRLTHCLVNGRRCPTTLTHGFQRHWLPTAMLSEPESLTMPRDAQTRCSCQHGANLLHRIPSLKPAAKRETHEHHRRARAGRVHGRRRAVRSKRDRVRRCETATTKQAS